MLNAQVIRPFDSSCSIFYKIDIEHEQSEKYSFSAFFCFYDLDLDLVCHYRKQSVCLLQSISDFLNYVKKQTYFCHAVLIRYADYKKKWCIFNMYACYLDLDLEC